MALITHKTLRGAAEALQVHPHTLTAWKRYPDVQEALIEAKRAAFQEAVDMLAHAMTRAVTVLLDLMDDPLSPAWLRAQCARDIVMLAFKARESEDVMERLAKLEVLLGEYHDAQEY
jgi:hypothetical protein